MRLTIRASMRLFLCLTALILMARDVGAQFLQYTPPGGPEEKPESRQTQLEREIKDARYHLGPVRIAPWASLHDLAYVHSILSTGQSLPNDLTATVGAGFRAYLHNGPKVIWTAQVLPEYVWWQRESGRRRLDGRYLLSYSGFFNHVTLEVRLGREQQQQIVTPEVPVPVSSRRDGGEVLTEVRISGAFSAFAAASFNRQNHLVEDVGVPSTQALRLLDADERIARAGVRWRPDPQWSVGLGAERSQVDFLHGTLDRSNAGTAPVTEIRFQGLHVGFQADAAARSLAASRGAEFVPYHKVTGNAALLLGSEAHLGAMIYASRNLVYSLSPLYAYLDDQRLGTALTLRLGRRTRGRLFVEGGRNDYTAFAAGTPLRREDVSSYGGSLTFGLRGGLTLGVQGVRSQFSSNLAGGDHSYTSVGATVNLVGFQ
ncbi:MAG TPA: hypothetical protein VGH73_02285 [Thermoanaerobaculia bacterium]|jgi:hypothetical protein